MKPKIIFFDVGNIFMTFDKIFTRVCADLNLDLKKFDEAYSPYNLRAELGKIDIPDIWAKICTTLNIKDGLSYSIIEKWISDHESILPMHEFVTSLQGKYQLGIISNYYRGYFTEATRQGFIPQINFSPLIISAEVGLVKPHRQIYDLAQDKCGFSGSEILFIDDKPENMVVPQTLGWQTFVFNYHQPEQSILELQKII
jgi:FMN phosphatase YigB (HAD superfamily)